MPACRYVLILLMINVLLHGEIAVRYILSLDHLAADLSLAVFFTVR